MMIIRSRQSQYVLKTIVVILGANVAMPVYCGTLGDVPVNDDANCASYVDLEPPVDFSKDQEVWITLDRSDKNATKEVYVRFVPTNGSFNSDAIGIAIVKLTDDIIKIHLTKDYHQIKQLSIHGGLKPFGKHPMPLNAGTACPNMMSVEIKP